MVGMDILKQLVGLLFITLAWIDPFNLGVEFQVLFFILGFDLTHIILKLVLFVAEMFLNISGLGWYLIGFIAVEALFHFLKLKGLLKYIIKPLVVFLIIFINGLGIELGIVVAGIDLLLNYTKKYI